MKPMRITTTWRNPATDNLLRITGTVYPRIYPTREDPGEDSSAEVARVELEVEPGVFLALDMRLIPNNVFTQMEEALIQAAAEKENDYDRIY